MNHKLNLSENVEAALLRAAALSLTLDRRCIDSSLLLAALLHETPTMRGSAILESGLAKAAIVDFRMQSKIEEICSGEGYVQISTQCMDILEYANREACGSQVSNLRVMLSLLIVRPPLIKALCEALMISTESYHRSLKELRHAIKIEQYRAAK